MFQNRSTEPEIMDDLQCNGPVVVQTLRELDFINKWLGGNDVTMNAFAECLKQLNGNETNAPLHIADLGCGSGDILKQIAVASRKEKMNVLLTGIDANSFIIEYAKSNSDNFPEIQYKDENIFSENFKKAKFDIVNATLFLHHFSNEQLKEILTSLKNQTKYAIIINDLHRHWLAYHSIKILTQFFSKSSMVKYDAKLSVLRGFTKKELESLIKAVGFRKFSIKWKWAFRFQIILWI